MTHHEEFTIVRPGHHFPWMAVVQEEDGKIAWGIYSQSGRAAHPFSRGSADSIEEARRSARVAAKELS